MLHNAARLLFIKASEELTFSIIRAIKNKEVVSSSEKLLAKKIFSSVTLISEDIQAQCQQLRHYNVYTEENLVLLWY
jgi:hypothetical protein